MPDKNIFLETKGHVATLVINRPDKMNSFNHGMLTEMAGHLENLAESADIRALVIRGGGSVSFSTGYDISELSRKSADRHDVMALVKSALDRGLGAIENYPYPVIAMINGYALGGGCELALTCDIRVASEKTRMGIPSSRLGIVYQPSGIQKVINIIGMANARELFYTGMYFDTGRIREMGLVNHVVPEDRLEAFTYELAGEIADNAPMALRGVKRIFNAINNALPVAPEAMGEIQGLIDASFRSDDFREASAAFLEKRKPRFTGR